MVVQSQAVDEAPRLLLAKSLCNTHAQNGRTINTTSPPDLHWSLYTQAGTTGTGFFADEI